VHRWKALRDKVSVALCHILYRSVQVADSSCDQSLGAGGRRFKSYRPDQFYHVLRGASACEQYTCPHECPHAPVFTPKLNAEHIRSRFGGGHETGHSSMLDASDQSLENDPVMPKSLSERLAGIVLPDSEARLVRLGSLWANGAVVISFLRHYG
jgi:hypothetical protein